MAALLTVGLIAELRSEYVVTEEIKKSSAGCGLAIALDVVRISKVASQ